MCKHMHLHGPAMQLQACLNLFTLKGRGFRWVEHSEVRYLEYHVIRLSNYGKFHLKVVEETAQGRVNMN